MPKTIAEAKNDLRANVAFCLRELVWSNKYPVQPTVILGALEEGFAQEGFRVSFSPDDSEFKMSGSVLVDGKPVSVQTKMSTQKIFSGYEWSFHGCPTHAYHAILDAFREVNRQISFGRSEAKSGFCDDEFSRKVMHSMDDYLAVMFSRHHETLLIPIGVSGRVPLGVPRAFDVVAEQFPLDLYVQSLQRAEGKDSFGSPDLVPFIRRSAADPRYANGFTDDYFPNPSMLRDLFWGMYLLHVAKEKGYPLKERTDSPLEYVAVRGHDGLVSGDDLLRRMEQERLRIKRTNTD